MKINGNGQAAILTAEGAGIKNVSTHSFRRTALTTMSNAGVPLQTIQKISRHKNLEQLARYLKVSDQQVYNAALTLNF